MPDAQEPVPPTGIRRGLTNYGDPEFSLFVRGAFARGMGLTGEDLSRPVIGLAQTWSEFNPCHRHLREVAEAVKRGVWQAGGLPLEFPTISLGEIFLSPTSMLFRNLMAMDTEEMILGQPMDGVVLLGGCDKTLPAQLMGAASADRPAIVVTAGPMLTGRYEGMRLGACTDCRAALDRAPRGGDRRAPHGGDPGRAVPLDRHVHGHGDRQHDGGDDGGPGNDAAGHGGHSRAALPPPAPGGSGRPADRRDGAGGSPAVPDPHPRGVRERRAGPHGDRRLDERRRPPAGDRRTGRRPPRARRLRPVRPHHAHGGERPAVGEVPHGGPRRGGRHPGGDEGARPASPPGRADGDRANARRHAGRRAGPRRLAGRGHDPRPAVQGGGRPRHPPRAASPPTARCSRCRPPRRPSSATAAPPASSATSPTSRPGSTTRRCPSRRRASSCSRTPAPWAARECPRPARSRFRRSCSRRASGTWCGSRTRG